MVYNVGQWKCQVLNSKGEKLNIKSESFSVPVELSHNHTATTAYQCIHDMSGITELCRELRDTWLRCVGHARTL